MGPLAQQLFADASAEVYRYSSEPFKLASGQLSHHYFNCKRITLTPARLALLARVFCDEVIPQSGPAPEAAGGLTLGADPIAYAVSLAYLAKGQTVYPLIVRKEAKEHGLARRIEGEYQLVKEVLLIDDVVTTAGSSLKAVEAFRAAGLTVRRCICIVDREEGGREALKAAGIDLFAVFKKSDFSA